MEHSIHPPAGMSKRPKILTVIGLSLLCLCCEQALTTLPIRTVLPQLSPVIAMPKPLLDDQTIRDRIQALPGWTTDGKALYATRKFKNFIEAVAFVNQLVEPAEAANHHPDISISYNKVSITITTHDAGGLTDLDFQLAHTISGIHGIGN